MKVFVTGASGYIGRAVAEALRRRGHRVAGLTRSAVKAKTLEAREIEAVVGDMRDPSAWGAPASTAEVLIHCAVEYGAEYEALDLKVVEAFAGFGGRTIYTSGVWQYGPALDGAMDETMAFTGKPLMPWRSGHEERVLMSKGLVIRAGGLTGLWFAGALDRKEAPIVGEGANRWAVVHLEDLADLYVRAAESGVGSALYNGVDRSRRTVREMAEAASRAAGAGGAVKSLSLPEAEKLYGPMAHGLAMDQHIDSSKAHKFLGWSPHFNGFPAEADRFFASWKANKES
jgi:nucleoside-diphosphate-sugar epimerase